MNRIDDLRVALCAVVFASAFALSSPAGLAQDFNCTSVLKSQVNGSWYANFSECSTEPRQNITVIENITTIENITIINQTFDQTTIGAQLAEISLNLTSTLNEKLDAERRLVDINTTFQLCINEAQRTSNYSAVVNDLNTCNEGRTSTQSSLAVTSSQRDELEQNTLYYQFGVGGLALLLLYTNRKRIGREVGMGTRQENTASANFRIRPASPLREEVQAEVKADELESLKQEIEKLKKKGK